MKLFLLFFFCAGQLATANLQSSTDILTGVFVYPLQLLTTCQVNNYTVSFTDLAHLTTVIKSNQKQNNKKNKKLKNQILVS
jgi:hypothetical protein